jgi:transcriptional regulator with XRE-family HTH domain
VVYLYGRKDMKTKLRPIRKEEGLTKEELSTRSKVSVGSITKAENGEERLKMETLAKILRGLNGFIREQGGKNEKYKLEDIFPGFDKRT